MNLNQPIFVTLLAFALMLGKRIFDIENAKSVQKWYKRAEWQLQQIFHECQKLEECLEICFIIHKTSLLHGNKYSKEIRELHKIGESIFMSTQIAIFLFMILAI